MKYNNILSLLILIFLSACGGGFLGLKAVEKYKNSSALEFIEQRFCSSLYETIMDNISSGISYVTGIVDTEDGKRYKENFRDKYRSKSSKNSCSKVYYTTPLNPYQLYMPYNDVELFCHIKGGRLILKQKGYIGFMANYLLNPYVMSYSTYKNSRDIEFSTEIISGISVKHKITKEDQAKEVFYKVLSYNNSIEKGKESLEIPNQYGYFGSYVCQNRQDSSEMFIVSINPISWNKSVNTNLNNIEFGATRILISIDDK